MAHILVTGGAGYIGAHVVRELAKQGYTVVVLDNLSTGKRSNVADEITVVEGDFGNEELLTTVFTSHQFDAVIHMAASIEVGESVEKPLEYLNNNALKTHRLLQVMSEHGVKKIIFSSTAAVYGLQAKMPIAEDAPVGPLDPYGYSKLISEHLIRYYSSFVGIDAVIFRYFNACGSDFDKTIYSTHTSHLIPHVVDVVQGRKTHVQVYGNDYDTVDGTGVRDYVHVLDIARAHVAGLEYLQNHAGVSLYNIGTGQGQSVMQVVEAVRQLTSYEVPVVIKERRPGDSPITVADNTKIKQELGFELRFSDIKTIVETSLH